MTWHDARAIGEASELARAKSFGCEHGSQPPHSGAGKAWVLVRGVV